jgi:chromosome segregation ATPase
VDKLKKEAKEKLKEYEEKLTKKNKTINDLLTDSENNQTEIKSLKMNATMKKALETKLMQDLADMKEKMQKNEKLNETVIEVKNKEKESLSAL